jgi:uncharacterized Zn-finger protein
MFGWLRANAPAIFAKLWPQIDGSSPLSVSSSKLKTAAKNIQDIDQTFRCESCSATFKSREDLKNHTIEKHE